MIVLLNLNLNAYCLLPQITALCANTNNNASTVLELFLSAVMTYGHSSCVRGDSGGENVLVSTYMIMKSKQGVISVGEVSNIGVHACTDLLISHL